MAAQEIIPEWCDSGLEEPRLRLIRSQDVRTSLRHGDAVAIRRARRARVQRRRRIAAVSAILGLALFVLAVPGHVLGATTGAGLSTDLASSTTLASGMQYVVQPGDSVESLAREMNPLDPSLARSLLVRELGSDVVVVGERVLIP